jgi:hypothetical protein
MYNFKNSIELALLLQQHNLEDIENLLEITEIVYNNIKDYKKINFENEKIKLSKNIKYVSEFLKKHNLEYNEKFLNLLNNNVFTFERFDDENSIYFSSNDDIMKTKINDKTPYSFINPETLKHEIYIPVKNNIGDAFAILHESFHEFNHFNEVTFNSLSRNHLSEGVSMASEFLFEDYLKKIKVDGYKYGPYENIKYIEEITKLVLTKLKVIQLYLKDKNTYMFYDIVYKTKIDKELLRQINNFIYMNEFRYIIGILLASEINDFKTLKLMNESINEYDVSLAIKILGLNGRKIKNYIKYDQKSLYKVDNDFQKLLKRRGYYE